MEDEDGEDDAFYGEEAPEIDLWELNDEADDAPMQYYDEILGSSDP